MTNSIAAHIYIAFNYEGYVGKHESYMKDYIQRLEDEKAVGVTEN